MWFFFQMCLFNMQDYNVIRFFLQNGHIFIPLLISKLLDSRQLSLKMQIMQNMSLKCARFECNENINVIPLELTHSLCC